MLLHLGKRLSWPWPWLSVVKKLSTGFSSARLKVTDSVDTKWRWWLRWSSTSALTNAEGGVFWKQLGCCRSHVFLVTHFYRGTLTAVILNSRRGFSTFIELYCLFRDKCSSFCDVDAGWQHNSMTIALLLQDVCSFFVYISEMLLPLLHVICLLGWSFLTLRINSCGKSHLALWKRKLVVTTVSLGRCPVKWWTCHSCTSAPRWRLNFSNTAFWIGAASFLSADEWL